jgi:hypothetical protein
MSELDGTVEEEMGPLGRGKHPREPVALGRWVNPILGVLGILVLSGYLITGQPSAPAATAPAPLSDERPTPAYSQATGDLVPSGVAPDESTFSTTTDLLETVFAAIVALAWAVAVSWLAMRRSRTSNLLHGPAAYPTQTAYHSLRAPTCVRMYDESRLLPQYIRSVEFPATKRDLVRLAKEHTDEGSALRRLECIPDRCYSSLHDLITEIRVD